MFKLCQFSENAEVLFEEVISDNVLTGSEEMEERI